MLFNIDEQSVDASRHVMMADRRAVRRRRITFGHRATKTTAAAPKLMWGPGHRIRQPGEP
jgi:hypothetical protein